MAEEEDSRRTSSDSTNETGSKNEANDHNQDQDEAGWLRLGIGTSNDENHNKMNNSNDKNKHSDNHDLELNLVPGGGARLNGGGACSLSPPAPLVYYHQPPQSVQVQQDLQLSSWANSNYFRMITPLLPNYNSNPTRSVLMVAPHPSSTPPAPSFLMHPRATSFQLPGPGPVNSGDIIRLIDPPRRPHSGIWFLLQPSLHQAKEPFLPQLPKNYLRIKDGRMTVRLLIKYIVNKLGLESESEVEVRCRGHQLEPSLTMQYVRDHIWNNSSSSNIATNASSFTLIPHSSASHHHLMLLHYSRSS